MGREESLVSTAVDLHTTALDLPIESGESYEYAALHLKDVRRLEKEIKEFFKPIKQQQDKAKKLILDREKEALAPVLEARSVLEGRMKTYLAEIESQRKKEMELNKKQAEEDAKEAGVDPGLMVIEEPQTEAPKVKGISTSGYWDFEILDPSKVDPKFLIPDDKTIRKHVKAMGMDAQAFIGGIRVFRQTSLKTRL
jgi:hypothetical protein